MTTLRNSHKLFINEYLKDFNGTEAYIRTGLPCKERKIATSMSQKYLALDVVQKAIAEAVEARCKRIEVSVDMIIKELHQIATSDVGLLFNKDNNTLKDLSDIPEHLRKAISSIEVDETYEGSGDNRVWTGYTRKVKFWEKTKALEMLGKHLQMWIDRLELKGDITVVHGHREPKQ